MLKQTRTLERGVVHVSREAEVSDAETAILGDEEVSWLQISVCNSHHTNNNTHSDANTHEILQLHALLLSLPTFVLRSISGAFLSNFVCFE
jgi:hypothetical protein